jgi:Clathrin adaptor complex small chain
MVLSFILIQNRQGKTRLAKWYAPYTDEEKVKLKGEVYCSPSIALRPLRRSFLGPVLLVADRAFIHRFIASLRPATRSTNQISSSSDLRLHPLHPHPLSAKTSPAPRLSIEDMRDYFSASAWMQMTMNWPISRLYISSSKCSINSSAMSAN